MTATVTRVLLFAEADDAAEIIAVLVAFARADHVTWLPYNHGDGTETKATTARPPSTSRSVPGPCRQCLR